MSADARLTQVYKLAVYAVIAASLVAVIWPMKWPYREDSFPLSSYPMFSGRLENGLITLPYALGVEADGTSLLISPSYVANSEVLQARAAFRHAYTSPQAAADLCRKIAARVASSGGDELARVVEIRLISGRVDAVKFLQGNREGGDETEKSRCRVERP